MASTRAFGGVQLGYAGRQFAKPLAPVVGADAGIAIPIGALRATQLCTSVQSLYEEGPNNSVDRNRSVRSALGLSLGRAIGISNTVAVVPFVQSNLLHLSMRTQRAGFSPSAPAVLSTDKFYGEVGVGFGLRLGNAMTITPSFRIPVAAGPSDSRFMFTSGQRLSDTRFGVYQQVYSVSATLGFPR